MANFRVFVIICLSISMNTVLGAVGRGPHNTGVYVAPHYNNNTPGNWSYRHYYNGNDVGTYDNNAVIYDNTNGDDDTEVPPPVVVNPVVVDSNTVDSDDNVNSANIPVNNDANIPVKVYQYTDKNGVTHFSDLPFK